MTTAKSCCARTPRSRVRDILPMYEFSHSQGIFDRSSRFCLEVDVRLAPKATLGVSGDELHPQADVDAHHATAKRARLSVGDPTFPTNIHKNQYSQEPIFHKRCASGVLS